MAAAGGGGAGPGGKIRSRRYHLSSGRAPYSKNRLQGQQGIISRVTDTVKSIVPGWLQNYFNKNETSDGVQKTSVSVVENADNKNSDIHHHIYIEDDGSPATNDGRITPEPVINLADEEPSTSRSTLNLPEVLTRPCLHRANLNFNILDSPALNCQPSTSSAFPIGSSGFSLVKEIKDSTSQHDDDNISTTSGFSSRASDKDVTISRNSNAPPLWTPEADRSQPLSHNSSMSSKKPMFNLSTFGTLSPSLGNTSVLKSSQLGDSPFYPGKTTYGGAAARPSRVRATPYQAPVRRQVKAKPANVQSYGVTSATARRILQSLEKMSSPLADAKRIPSVSSSPLSFTPEKSFSDVEENPSKRKKVDSAYPPVKKLMTPKSIAISTNRSFYIKPSLTPSAVANTTSRRIQTEKHREPRRNHDPDQPLVPQSESNFSYPKFSTPASNGLSPGGGGKMMRGRGSHYTTKLADEETEVPTLPEVPLPLSTAALPSFNFSTLSSTTSPPVTVSKPADSKVQTDVVNKNPMFTFSSPIVKSTESNAQSPGSSVGFTFSVPSVKSSSPPITVNNTMFAIGSPAKTTIALNNGSAKKKEEEQGGFCKPAKELKEGSVMDILRGPGFSSPSSSQTASPTISKSTAPLTKPTVSTFSIGKVAFGEGNKQALGLWQCNTCLVENKASDGKCVACSALKEQPVGALKSQTTSTLLSNTKNSDVTSTQGFGDIFKVAPGTWECETCLVQNKPEVIKCVACETPKPGAGVKPALLLTPSTQAVKAITTSDKTLANAPCSLFEAFKKPEGSWECSVCCVQNKEQDSKCVACTSEKPGSSSSVKTATSVSFTPTCSNQLGLTDVFKRPEGSWDCDVCLIQNKPEATKCVACENNKPGTKAELKGFGTSSLSTGSSAPSFKFGLQPSSSTDELKSGVSTDSTPSKTSLESGFNFPSSGGKFTFGISSTKPAEETKKMFSADISTSNSSSTGFKFGTTTPQPESGSKSLSSSFSFGKVSNTSSAPVADSSSGSGFQFQVAKELSTPTISFNPKESEGKTSESALGGFTFGKVEHNKETSSTFVFGKKDEKTDSTNTGQVIFGVKREMEEPKQFSFSKSEQTKDNTATPTFAFGVPNPTEKKNSDNTTKPGFCFAPQTTSADTEASKQTFSLIGSGSSGTQSGASASSSNAFGSTVPTGASASTSSLFGIAAQSSTPSGSTGLFGSTTQSTTSVSTSGVFGSIVPTSAPVSTSSVFGITAQSSTSAGSSGLFGSVVQSSASAGSGSVFGTAASSSTPAASSSVFGNSASSITPAGSSSVFGNAASSSTPAGSTSVFGSGAPSNAPAGSSSVFGSAATSTTPANSNSVFGSATPITTSSSSIFGAAPTSTSANSSSIFGSSTTTSNTLAGTFMFGQPSSTAGGSVFGSTTESKSSFVFSGQESKPATTSTSTPVASPFLFGANPGATNPVQGFNFGGANASNVSGSASTPTPTPFVFGASSSAPAPSALAVSANTVPAFGQSASQTNVPAFGSSSTLFPSGSQNVPAFGSVSSTSQPPAFGQQATQPSFGSSPAPAPGSGFQFGGNTNFNFASGASSGVFTFGSSSAGASTQPAQSGFMFNQTPTFNLGTNGRNAAPPPPSIATRKIKTARRRK